MTDNKTGYIIEHCGTAQTIEYMIERVKKNYASFHHWNKVLDLTLAMYHKARDEKDYGVLLPKTMIVDKIDAYELSGMMSQGGYPDKECLKLLEMYEFLLSEDCTEDHPIQSKITPNCELCDIYLAFKKSGISLEEWIIRTEEQHD